MVENIRDLDRKCPSLSPRGVFQVPALVLAPVPMPRREEPTRRSKEEHRMVKKRTSQKGGVAGVFGEQET